GLFGMDMWGSLLMCRFDNIERRLENPPPPVLVSDRFPSDRHHGWKYIKISPYDNRLYVPVGAPCNHCNRSDPYATIMSMKLDGSDLRVIARVITLFVLIENREFEIQ